MCFYFTYPVTVLERAGYDRAFAVILYYIDHTQIKTDPAHLFIKTT